MASNPDPLEAGWALAQRPAAAPHAEGAACGAPARSDRDGASLNQWIVSALSRALEDGARTPCAGRARLPRELRVALIVNAVVIAVAVVVAIVLIVLGW